MIYSIFVILILLNFGGTNLIASPNKECRNKNNGLGPYYPPDPLGLPFYGAEALSNPSLGNFNLTVNPLNGKKAKGDYVRLTGKISIMGGNPLKAALVELWNTNIYGSYVVEKSPKGSDPGFFGYGKVLTNEKGDFEFLTIVPIAYTRYGFLIARPPHFHFRITHPTIDELGLEVDLSAQELDPNLCENKVFLNFISTENIPYQGKINIFVTENQK